MKDKLKPQRFPQLLLETSGGSRNNSARKINTFTETRKGIKLSKWQNSRALGAPQTQLKTSGRLPGAEGLLRTVSAELREAKQLCRGSRERCSGQGHGPQTFRRDSGRGAPSPRSARSGHRAALRRSQGCGAGPGRAGQEAAAASPGACRRPRGKPKVLPSGGAGRQRGTPARPGSPLPARPRRLWPAAPPPVLALLMATEGGGGGTGTDDDKSWPPGPRGPRRPLVAPRPGRRQAQVGAGVGARPRRATPKLLRNPPFPGRGEGKEGGWGGRKGEKKKINNSHAPSPNLGGHKAGVYSSLTDLEGGGGEKKKKTKMK